MKKLYLTYIFSAILMNCPIYVQVAAGDSSDLYRQLSSLDGSANDLRIAQQLFRSAPSMPPDARETLVELAALISLKQQRTDIYERIRPSLNRASYIEQHLRDDCPACRGQGYSSRRCDECGGRGSCRHCGGRGQRQVPSIGRDIRIVPCHPCGRAGHCTQCNGNRSVRLTCTRCEGRQKLWSPERINKMFDTHIEMAKIDTLRPRIMRSIVLIAGDRSRGSGFVIEHGEHRYVVSNAHVFIGNREVELRRAHGGLLEFDAIYPATDRDLIYFRLVPGTDAPPLPVASELHTIHHGQRVAVYGDSQGADVATSIVGSILGVGPRLIETDAEFVAGNSGSPLLVEDRVVGVATFAQRFNRDWVTEGTRFTRVRRFAVRMDDIHVADLPLVDMFQYLQQVEALSDLDELVNNTLRSSRQSSLIATLERLDVTQLDSAIARVNQIPEWAIYMMEDQANNLKLIANALLEAKAGLEELRRTQAALEREAAANRPGIASVVDSLMHEQARGRYGLQYWADPSRATRLFAPASWDILETAVSGVDATALIRVESSTRGGIPIRRLWSINLRFLAEGWRVLHISQAD